jgi:20S proteasome alpha/beta subunit
MTLVVGIIAKDGIVLASDSRMTSGITSNDTIQKIFKLNERSAVGVSGDGTLGIHFLEVITDELTFEKGILNLVEQIRVKGKEKFDDYFGHQPPKDRPILRFLIAGYTKDNKPKLYELSSNDNFVPRPSSTGFDCMGIPYFAEYLLNRFYESEINVKQAQILAAFCVQETSSQAHGVGGEIKMASFSTSKSYAELTPTELNEIQKVCGSLHVMNKSKFYPEENQ